MHERRSRQIVRQCSELAVAVGQQGLAHRPGNPKGRVIPDDASLVGRAIDVTGLVQHLRFVGENTEAMRETGGDIKAGGSSPRSTLPPPTARRCTSPTRMSTATSQIAPRTTRISFTWSAGGSWKCRPRSVCPTGSGMVILHKQGVDSLALQCLPVVALQEEASRIAEDARRQDEAHRADR